MGKEDNFFIRNINFDTVAWYCKGQRKERPIPVYWLRPVTIYSFQLHTLETLNEREFSFPRMFHKRRTKWEGCPTFHL